MSNILSNAFGLKQGVSYRFVEVPIEAVGQFVQTAINGGWIVGGSLPSDEEDAAAGPVGPGLHRIWNVEYQGAVVRPQS